MTEIEFKTLIDGTLSACFPETGRWLAGLPNRKDVLEVWRRELIDLDFKLAKLAIERIHSGREPGPAAYERETWPGFIRRAVLAYKAAQVADANLWRDTYFCLECRDIGSIECYSEKAVEAVLQEKNDAVIERLPTVWYQCTCKRGKQWIVRTRGPNKPVAVFDEQRAVRIAAGVATLRDFVVERGFRFAGVFYEEFVALANTREGMDDATPWERGATLATETDRIAREMVK